MSWSFLLKLHALLVRNLVFIVTFAFLLLFSLKTEFVEEILLIYFRRVLFLLLTSRIWSIVNIVFFISFLCLLVFLLQLFSHRSSLFKSFVLPLDFIVQLLVVILVTNQVITIFLDVVFVLTHVPVLLEEVILGDNAEVISPKKRLKWLFFLWALFGINADMVVLYVLHAEGHSRQVLNTTLGRLRVLSRRAI